MDLYDFPLGNAAITQLDSLRLRLTFENDVQADRFAAFLRSAGVHVRQYEACVIVTRARHTRRPCLFAGCSADADRTGYCREHYPAAQAPR